MGDKQQIGARIPSDLYRKVRVLAAEEDTTVAALIEEAVKDLLRKRSRRG